MPALSTYTPEIPAVDVAVIGAGINGLAVAREAAARGLTVALFDQDDLAARTSAISTRLIHGGLKYLERFELHREHEGWRLRGTILASGDGLPAEARYEVRCDEAWRTTQLAVELRRGGTADLGDLDAAAGFDTPSLVGAWDTGPYLHHADALTLQQVMTTYNPNDEHGTTSQLSAAQIDFIADVVCPWCYLGWRRLHKALEMRPDI